MHQDEQLTHQHAPPSSAEMMHYRWSGLTVMIIHRRASRELCLHDALQGFRAGLAVTALQH
jgi:hypothetical protein